MHLYIFMTGNCACWFANMGDLRAAKDRGGTTWYRILIALNDPNQHRTEPGSSPARSHMTSPALRPACTLSSFHHLTPH